MFKRRWITHKLNIETFIFFSVWVIRRRLHIDKCGFSGFIPWWHCPDKIPDKTLRVYSVSECFAGVYISINMDSIDVKMPANHSQT